MKIVQRIWDLVDDFVNELPAEVNSVYFEAKIKEALNEIKNLF